MPDASLASLMTGGSRKAKAAGESIHYIVFREKDGTWNKVRDFFRTDSAAVIAGSILAMIDRAPVEFSDVMRLTVARITGQAAPAPKAPKAPKAPAPAAESA